MHGAGQETAVPERLTDGKRKGGKREAGREKWVRNGRAGKTTGERDFVGRFGCGGHGLAGNGSGAAGWTCVSPKRPRSAGKTKAGCHHAEMGRAVRQSAMRGGHGRSEARCKAAGTEFGIRYIVPNTETVLGTLFQDLGIRYIVPNTVFRY